MLPQEMAAILSHPRVYSFLHVPVQSGSDKVLADMKREYTAADFRELVDYLRKQLSEHYPGLLSVSIACVIILKGSQYHHSN